MAGRPSRRALYARAARVKVLIVDVDGVLTDGGIVITDEGREIKRFNVRDGHGIKLLQRAGVEVAVITGRQSRVVEIRTAELGIKHVYQRSLRKLEAYEDLKRKLGVEDAEVAFVGDDVVDIPILVRAGLPVAVSDAAEEAKANAFWVTERGGGAGAVREVTDLILKAKGLWDDIIAAYAKI